MEKRENQLLVMLMRIVIYKVYSVFTKGRKKGFTLIELLVVISIIGILAALTLTGFNAARKNARDTTRKSDLQQYRVALEAFASNNNGKYPDDNCGLDGAAGTCQGNSECYMSCSGLFNPDDRYSPIITEYLPATIHDPRGGTNNPNDGNTPYRYRYYEDLSGSGRGYKLVAGLETGGFWMVCSNGKAGKVAAFNGSAPPGTDGSTCQLPE